MKKIKFILFVFMLMSFPFYVKADASPPTVTYKVRVSNYDGAYLYNYDSKNKAYVKTENKILYDEVVEIIDEIEVDDQLFGYFHIIGGGNDKKSYGLINLANTLPVVIDLSDYYHEEVRTYYIFDDSCSLYDGPSSNFYNEIGSTTLSDKGTTFTSNYYHGAWVYVESKKAWIETFYIEANDAGVVYFDADKKYLALEEINIYDNPKTMKNVLGTIPKGTEFISRGYYNSRKNGSFSYVNYNGITGFFSSNDNVAKGTNNRFRVESNDGVKLYEKWDVNSSVIASIPYAVYLDADYFIWSSAKMMYRVKYNNQVGFVEGNNDSLTVIASSNEDDSLPDHGDNLPNDNGEPDIILNDDKMSLNEVIILCIFVAVFSSLTAFVTILLLNKKKEKKNVI